MRRILALVVLATFLSVVCVAQTTAGPLSQDGDSTSSSKPNAKRPANQTPPRSADDSSSDAGGESSSRSTKIDLSPPPGEAAAPGIGATEDVQEMKPWDPHKADKNIEVGSYYYKQKNYRAAESRFQEALYWQDNNAEASYCLAVTEEKLGKLPEARKYFEAYLKILPDGEFAQKAREGLARVSTEAPAQQKAEAKPKK